MEGADQGMQSIQHSASTCTPLFIFKKFSVKQVSSVKLGHDIHNLVSSMHAGIVQFLQAME